MFVIEKLIGDFDAKQKAYEHRSQKWVDEGEDKNGYNHRSLSDYQCMFGKSPKHTAALCAKIALIIVLGLVIAFLMTRFITISVEKEAKTPTKAEVKEK